MHTCYPPTPTHPTPHTPLVGDILKITHFYPSDLKPYVHPYFTPNSEKLGLPLRKRCMNRSGLIPDHHSASTFNIKSSYTNIPIMYHFQFWDQVDRTHPQLLENYSGKKTCDLYYTIYSTLTGLQSFASNSLRISANHLMPLSVSRVHPLRSMLGIIPHWIFCSWK